MFICQTACLVGLLGYRISLVASSQDNDNTFVFLSLMNEYTHVVYFF